MLLLYTLLFIWWNIWTRMVYIWVCLGYSEARAVAVGFSALISVQRSRSFSSLFILELLSFRFLFDFSPFSRSRVSMRILLITRFIADECILVLWYMVYVCTLLPQTYVSSAMR